jgi:hypothetical protein
VGVAATPAAPAATVGTMTAVPAAAAPGVVASRVAGFCCVQPAMARTRIKIIAKVRIEDRFISWPPFVRADISLLNIHYIKIDLLLFYHGVLYMSSYFL